MGFGILDRTSRAEHTATQASQPASPEVLSSQENDIVNLNRIHTSLVEDTTKHDQSKGPNPEQANVEPNDIDSQVDVVLKQAEAILESQGGLDAHKNKYGGDITKCPFAGQLGAIGLKMVDKAEAGKQNSGPGKTLKQLVAEKRQREKEQPSAQQNKSKVSVEVSRKSGQEDVLEGHGHSLAKKNEVASTLGTISAQLKAALEASARQILDKNSTAAEKQSILSSDDVDLEPAKPIEKEVSKPKVTNSIEQDATEPIILSSRANVNSNEYSPHDSQTSDKGSGHSSQTSLLAHEDLIDDKIAVIGNDAQQEINHHNPPDKKEPYLAATQEVAQDTDSIFEASMSVPPEVASDTRSLTENTEISELVELAEVERTDVTQLQETQFAAEALVADDPCDTLDNDALNAAVVPGTRGFVEHQIQVSDDAIFMTKESHGYDITPDTHSVVESAGSENVASAEEQNEQIITMVEELLEVAKTFELANIPDSKEAQELNDLCQQLFVLVEAGQDTSCTEKNIHAIVDMLVKNSDPAIKRLVQEISVELLNKRGTREHKLPLRKHLPQYKVENFVLLSRYILGRLNAQVSPLISSS